MTILKSKKSVNVFIIKYLLTGLNSKMYISYNLVYTGVISQNKGYPTKHAFVCIDTISIL